MADEETHADAAVPTEAKTAKRVTQKRPEKEEDESARLKRASWPSAPDANTGFGLS
jgi:hypothetical protein